MIDTQKIFDYDKEFLNDKIKFIAGIDEVGRGPLAGPVVTACVIMPYDNMINGVFDSKRICKKNREKLYDEIMSKAISVSISKRSQDDIDDINIRNATLECMKECYNNSKVEPDLLLVDAEKLKISRNEKAIIKGDATSYAIACASIIAKVYRDRIMEEYSKIYSEYDFENNMGYGTKKHRDAIKKFGITPIHRLSFVKNFIGKEECERIYMERREKRSQQVI